MTARPRRVVFDTNVVISALLRPGSVPDRAVQHALRNDVILVSKAALSELQQVLRRPKFQTIFLPAALDLLSSFTASFEPVKVTIPVSDCRDPRDNIFLSLALAGHVDLIITGDSDLLTLHPWRGISILTPADFLAQSTWACESIRGGDAIGTHVLTAPTSSERVILTHEAISRRGFAEGAVRAAEWLAHRTDSYDFRDIYTQL